MKTWEVMQRKRKFKRKSDGLELKISEDGTLQWASGYEFLNIHDEWEEVKKPVDFMTAIKSGKDIGVEYSRACYREMSLANLFYELQQDYSDNVIRKIILNGKWYIED